MKVFFSIKARLTLWYALLMLVVTVLVLVALMWSVGQAALAYHEGLLLQAMADAAKSVTEVNGVPCWTTGTWRTSIRSPLPCWTSRGGGGRATGRPLSFPLPMAPCGR